jgi:transmembrane sensor
MSAESIDEQAARWAERMRGPRLSDEEYGEFCSWLRSSPSCAEAFAGQQMLDVLINELRGTGALERARWRRRTRASLPNTQTSLWRVSAWAAGVVLLVIALGVLVVYRSGPVGRTFSTVAGEMREVHLDDGSVALLNTRTMIRSHSNAHERSVDLVDGEVLFDVRRDPARPFVVNVDSTRIRVIGTRFNVFRSKDDVRLSVLAGVVDIVGLGDDPAHRWHRQVQANEEVTYHRTGVVSELQGPTVQKRTLWTNHLVEVENEALPEVVNELSRYTDATIRLGDPRLQEVRVVATLDVSSVANALEKLQTLAPIRVERNGNAFVLRYRDDSHEPTVTARGGRP